MKKLLGIVVLGLLWCNVGYTENEKSIIKCADHSYQKDFDQNFFNYMYLFVNNKKQSEKYEIMADDSNFLFHHILVLTEAGFSQEEIVEHFKEVEKKDFESLKKTQKHTAISIKQNKDKFMKNVDKFFKQSPVNKRKDNLYTGFFLTCESQSKKDKDSFLEKWK